MRPHKILAFSLLCFLLNCSNEASLNTVWKSSADEERGDVLLEKAQTAYDQGDYKNAQLLAEKVAILDPQNKKAGIILGYSYLAEAGYNPLDVIKNIVSSDINKTNKTSLTAEDSSSTTTNSSSNAADILGSFSNIVKITDADFEKMGTLKTSDNKYFKNIPVFYPKNPGDSNTEGSPRKEVSSLRNLRIVQEKICPFISETVYQELKIDPPTGCTPAKKENASIQTHFIFAIANLVDALILYRVVNYSTQTEETTSSTSNSSSILESNVQKRIAKLNGAVSADNITSYIEAIALLKEDISAIYDTTNGTALAEILLSFRKVMAAFKEIPNIPQDITKQLSNALTSIEEAATKVNSTKDQLGQQTSGLKNLMVTKAVGGLATSLNSFLTKQNWSKANKSNLSTEDAEKLDQVCNSWDSIATGLPDVALDNC